LRTVQTDISNLALNLGDTVTLKLLDILGRDFTFMQDGKLIKYDETITIDKEVLSFELWENENSNSKTYYQLTINKINYKFTVPKGNGVHELMSLFSIACNDDVSYTVHGKTIFEDDFIEKIKRYFNQYEPYFTANQKRAFDQFVFFANNVHDTDTTIDNAEALNKYLGSL
jgi:hypothetical protein